MSESSTDEHSTRGSYVAAGQAFDRDTNYIEDRILDDPDAQWPVEAGRYRLVAARACPWANRTMIVRRLLGLEDAISLGMPGPTHDARSWTFDLDPGGVDPVLGIERLQQAFFARFPDYPRGITVPAIVDIPTGAVVTNDFPQITLDFSSQWTRFHREGAPDLCPEELRAEMDPLMRLIYTEINNGVYRCGFAGGQEAYESAFDRLFTALDTIEERLTTRRFLLGDRITEADVRLFTTLARFDAVYYSHFKCNRQRLSDFPAL
ncbi:MAG TPA: glutathione S-transferase C-terminal domain-containing protein, partial [Brevibacterium sp.]|nr:glutathione S-transferase C-terminal domain-containing protein [Brevibacterium sp.]